MRKHTAMIQNTCGITAATSKAASPMRAYTKHLDTIYTTSKCMATAGKSLQSNCNKTDVQAILCTKLLTSASRKASAGAAKEKTGQGKTSQRIALERKAAEFTTKPEQN